MERIFITTQSMLRDIVARMKKQRNGPTVKNGERRGPWDRALGDIGPDDLWIHLGSYCTGGDPNYETLHSLLLGHCRKAIVEFEPFGNEWMTPDWNCGVLGFDYYGDNVQIHNMLFTESAVEVRPGMLNIYGRRFDDPTYDPSTHICVDDVRGNLPKDRPLLLEDVLRAAAEFAETNKHDEWDSGKSLGRVYSKKERSGGHIVLTGEFKLYPTDEDAVPLTEAFLPMLYNTPEQLYDGMHRNIRYDSAGPDEWRFRAPGRVEKDRLGNCHDQAFYAASYLRKMGYEPELYFMIEYSGRYVHDAGTTHTLVCYKKDDKYYWLENAWGDHAGIHGPYDSTADIRRQVEAWWPKNRKYPKFYFGCIDIDSGDTVPFGVDLDDYVGFCLPKKLLGESSGCDELLDEILFPDTDDTKYWEQDDEKFKKRVEKSDQEIAGDSPADLAESVLQYHDWISQATHPARQLSENIADLDRMLTEASYRDRNNPHHWRPTNETGVVRNDKGAIVPNTCPVCGSDVKIFFRGEPVYLCSNKKCEKFFGVVPFHENAEAVWPPDGPYTITRLCMNDEIVGDRRTADTIDGAVRSVLDDPNCASESKVTPGIPWYLHSVVDGSLCCIGKIDILDADGNWKWIEKWDPETGGLLQETSTRSELDPNFKPRGKWDLVEFTRVTLTKDELKKHLDEPGWEMLKHVRHDEEKTSTVGWIDDEDKLVALVSVSYPGGTRGKASGKYNWITALEVRGDYRGCGLGKQVLDYAVKKLGGDALGVAYNNRVAQAMYTKYGFKRSKDSERAVDTKQSRNYLMYLHEDLSDIAGGFTNESIEVPANASGETPIGVRGRNLADPDDTSTLEYVYPSDVEEHNRRLSRYIDMGETTAKIHPEVAPNQTGAANMRDYGRDEKRDTAEKYDLRMVGATDDFDEDRETPAQKKKREEEEKLRKRYKQRLRALRKANRVKRHKRIVRKVKKLLPGAKNEAVDTVDNSSPEWETGGREVEYNELDGARRNVWDSPRHLRDASLDEGGLEHQETIYFADRINEAIFEDHGLYPVYVVLVHTGTKLSNVIRRATNGPFSHAAISFDSSMDHLYSFGTAGIGPDAKSPFSNGFTVDSLSSIASKHKNVPYAVYVVPSTKVEVDMMKQRLEYFVKNRTKFRYNKLGLLKTYLGISDNPQYKYFCSQFVADILRAGRPGNSFLADPSLIKPMDLTNFEEAIQVETGESIENYDSRRIDRETKRILNAAKLLRFVREKGVRLESYGENPWGMDILGYQLTVMDERSIDAFVDELGKW